MRFQSVRPPARPPFAGKQKKSDREEKALQAGRTTGSTIYSCCCCRRTRTTLQQEWIGNKKENQSCTRCVHTDKRRGRRSSEQRRREIRWTKSNIKGEGWTRNRKQTATTKTTGITIRGTRRSRFKQSENTTRLCSTVTTVTRWKLGAADQQRCCDCAKKERTETTQQSYRSGKANLYYVAHTSAPSTTEAEKRLGLFWNSLFYILQFMRCYIKTVTQFLFDFVLVCFYSCCL